MVASAQSTGGGVSGQQQVLVCWHGSSIFAQGVYNVLKKWAGLQVSGIDMAARNASTSFQRARPDMVVVSCFSCFSQKN